MKFPGKKVCVLGLGITGFETARFLKSKGFDVFVSDFRKNHHALSFAQNLSRFQVPVELGGHSLDKIQACDWAAISPGIPPQAPVYQALLKNKIPIYSEIEIAARFSPTRNIIAVTGTSGKTTVCTLIRDFLRTHGKRTFLCGNIGNPFISELEHLREGDFVVLETSSFQLKHCETLKPRIAALLNLSANHLDWHPDMEDYTAAKLRLFQCQSKEDFALFRSEDQKKYFPEFNFRAKTVALDTVSGPKSNLQAVKQIASFLKLDPAVADQIAADFRGIEHRMETFFVRDDVRYINDSKSTTPFSLEWGLNQFQDGSVILIAGGRAKSKDFKWIGKTLEKKVKKVYLIGESADQLLQAWGDSVPAEKKQRLVDAVDAAAQLAVAGDRVLLSPACASFDQFKNYIERGRAFKEEVCNYFALVRKLGANV